jgi:hypothetical protein
MSGWVERWRARAGAVLGSGLVACGSDAAGPPSAVDERLPPAVDEEGFLTAPQVAFPAPAVTAFGGGHLLCREERSLISAEIAGTLGFDVAGDRAVLEATQGLDVFTSWDDVQPTTVHLRGRIGSMMRVDRLPPVGVPAEEAVPAGCPSGVEYELIQQLYTDDGAVRGAFSVWVPATRSGESTARSLFADVDLRNLTGELPVGWLDSTEKVMPAAQIRWSVGAVPAPEFELTLTLWGSTASDACDWVVCRIDGDLGVPLSHGIAMYEDSLAGFGDVLRGALIYTERSTLSQLVARVDAYTPNVRVWVTAPAPSTAPPASGSRVHVIALNDAIYDATPMYFGSLDLASNTDRLADGIVSGFIDLGPLPESTNIMVQVQDELGLGSVRSHIIVDQCDIGRGTVSCVEPGCTMEVSVPVVAAGCMGAPSFPAR